jgi:hypothetical protein
MDEVLRHPVWMRVLLSNTPSTEELDSLRQYLLAGGVDVSGMNNAQMVLYCLDWMGSIFR